jgi:hypothetical protein
MVDSRELCSICARPFYRKQKNLRCGVCDLGFHCAFLQISDLNSPIYLYGVHEDNFTFFMQNEGK